ncbi:LLM class flavin-dependent oxidoreductase [Nocardia farcinica]|uniref:Nitrilotriacetate monooxygenase component A n=1 Tax=Nocardia farcinica TaxID=37329 RepID=A0A449G9D1_NOCFR|nr:MULTISPECIES: LLM class flavin-dependent oxidoreductase [Nocardia]MBA4856040.1 LLM class flavin-dependent oxidoreductase [Nocardia farcinica]MBC9818661.1 LLM class flavin-dependent oxidoreductase [Nocardia farcinica]MBF6188175.1 LLM class flavin-dependent oxidoreductase [Nocardia farcinica]MBF6265711.1 LLM class flavin-dependent oxidoreductase [Nocardia farcinica]MBF6284186.1 LLM class flavin-dependent oxidoreductase [Nocardia farcinica]
MTDRPRQLSLNAFIYPAGHHEAAWRHPASRPDRIYDVRYYQEIARTAEAATLDAVFFADGPALRTNVEYNAAPGLEPITLLTAIAAATSRIGLIATASTTYYEPYNLARLFASLDHLSGGRAGWNIVTTGTDLAAANFGLDRHPDHTERYARAREFVDAVVALWDSWEDDAILLDTAAGRYADPAKIHRIDFEGEYLRVRGPFNAARPPQGHPVLVQAGASNEGRAFAGRYAEAIFTAHQQLSDAQTFYADIKAKARAFGRDPEHVKILPGISPFIADTEAAARKLEREFNELTVPEYGLAQLAGIAGRDLRHLKLDEPVPVEEFDDAGEVTDNARSRLQVVAGIVRRERPTLRQLLHRLAGARGHRVFAGTPEQVADTIEEWFRHGAADGFNVMPPYYPGGLEVFTDTVVPILRERGLFRTEYSGTTLRDHFGLPRPESRFARRPVGVR